MTDASMILHDMQAVDAQRRARAADPRLASHVLGIKQYQHRRFQRTYDDLLANPRYAAAAEFFLEDLYGPKDHSERDAQFARIVPALARLFPPALVSTVADLTALHALSEQLDSAMARSLDGLPVDAVRYQRAWQLTGRADDRERQVTLMLAVGHALDGYTRNPMLRRSLKLMRGPARVAGLQALQALLERGFDTFAALGGADDFLGQISVRERALAMRLFKEPVSAPESSDELRRQLP